MGNTRLQLAYTTITVPTSGRVGNKNIEVEQRVQTEQTLMLAIEEKPWIVANFKETQLEKMQPGQAVKVKLDAFGNRRYQDKVDSFSPTSGAKFTYPGHSCNAAGHHRCSISTTSTHSRKSRRSLPRLSQDDNLGDNSEDS